MSSPAGGRPVKPTVPVIFSEENNCYSNTGRQPALGAYPDGWLDPLPMLGATTQNDVLGLQTFDSLHDASHEELFALPRARRAGCARPRADGRGCQRTSATV